MNRFDLTEFASMPHAEKLARSLSKRDLVLKFLSKGEVYLTIDVACALLELSRPTALTTLRKLEALGCLKTEAMMVPWKDHPRNTVLFGITPTGLAHAGADPTAPVFELGRTNSLYVQHHRQCQLLHVRALSLGWSGWVSERTLRDKNIKLKKIPDAIGLDPDGQRVAIEMERSVKSTKRYEQIQEQYLADLKKGKIDRVAYVCSPKIVNNVQKLFRHVEKHNFQFFSLDDWPLSPLPRLDQPVPTANNLRGAMRIVHLELPDE